MKALGMIETKGLLGAVEAADVACKTADVKILNKHLVKGGLVVIEVIGDVGAVKVAIDSAAEAVKRLGVYVSSHVIPRPAQEIFKMEEEILQKKNKMNEVLVEKIVEVEKKGNEIVVVEEIKMEQESQQESQQEIQQVTQQKIVQKPRSKK